VNWAAVLGLLGSFGAGLASDNAPPPAVAQNGVVNAASEMPAEFSGGSIARGSLFRVHGWRMGPAQPVHAAGYPLPETLAGLSIEVTQGAALVRPRLVSVSAREIEAILPSGSPIGEAVMTLVREGSRSEPFRFRVVPTSFGAFHAPGPRRGQGLIRNGESADDAVWNGLDHSAEPGEMVSLLGTGLGAEPGSDAGAPHRAPVVATPELRITVGGAPVRKIAWTGRSSSGSGVDELVFEVPPDAPEGCHVPVQVRSGAIASNFVSMAVHRGGGACTGPGDWIRSASNRVRNAGVVVLNHMDFWLRLEDGESARFRMDTALAKFVENFPVHGSADRFLSLPPPGACTAEEHFTQLRGLVTTVSPLDLIDGTALDAGEQLIVRGAAGTRHFGKPQGSDTYGGVLGGNAPVPTASNFPLFLRAGEYTISGNGPDTGAFAARLEAQKPIRWKDRDRILSVDRSRGVTVHWAAARRDDFVLIVAVNADNETGALGRALCVAPAQPGVFTMPASALTNLPPTRPGSGLPLNTLWVFEVPGRAPDPFRGQRLDRGIAFYVSASGRTVSFR